MVRDGLGRLGSNQPENTVPFVTWNTRNFIPEFLVEWKAPKECSRALHAWKAHLLLSVNQEEAKQNALTQLDEETCLIIMDWAMKYLPQHYREQISEFFGKRGRSWHISAVITRSQEERRCEVECFVHLFNTCKQNSFEVMSVTEHLLNTIKVEYPSINKAFLRSDNAGCYHSGPMILILP